jgi:IKI3 family
MPQVGYLDGGVAALRWAPDGETLCIITSRGQMLLMTKVSGCFSL